MPHDAWSVRNKIFVELIYSKAHLHAKHIVGTGD
jgi:hypothetical protein